MSTYMRHLGAYWSDLQVLQSTLDTSQGHLSKEHPGVFPPLGTY